MMSTGTHVQSPGHRPANGRVVLAAARCTLLCTLRYTLLCALMAACGTDSTARRTIIDSRDSEDPRSLDPALSTDVPTGRAVSYVFDGLTRFDESGRVVPNLATSWELSRDGMTYTFHLRRGVRFHDGTPLGARDVEHSFERVLDPHSKGGRGWPLYPIRGAKDYAAGKATRIDGIAVVDDSTVRLTLDEPFAIFVKMLAMPVASIVPRVTPDNFGEHPIGTGPWRFVAWRHDDYLLFARNPRYHGGAPLMDSLQARIIPEPSTAVAEYESGNVDVLAVPNRETRSWEANDELRPRLRAAASLRLIYAAMNVRRGALRDVRVRQAINYAVDRATILDRLIGGRGTLAAGVIPPSLDGADTTRRAYPYDVAKARQLLAEAGYAHGLSLELWCSQTDPFPRVAQTIQAYLARVGVRVTIVQRDGSSMREAARKGSTDIALKDWFADYPDAENFLYPLLHTANVGVGGNVSFYSNPAFDTVVTAARREANDARRITLYTAADSIAFADAPMLFLYFAKDVDAVQPWLRGFTVPAIFTGQRWTTVSIVHP